MKLNLTATVISAGRMMRAVKVRSSKQIYNGKIQKHFTAPTSHLVADPTSALHTGDVIRIAPEHHSRHIKHVVTEIISPWGVPINERPAILTREERAAVYNAKKERRAERERVLREGRQAKELEEGDGGFEERREREREGRVTGGRTQGVRERALGSEVKAGRIRGRLDTKGMDAGEVERKMEQVRI